MLDSYLVLEQIDDNDKLQNARDFKNKFLSFSPRRAGWCSSAIYLGSQGNSSFTIFNHGWLPRLPWAPQPSQMGDRAWKSTHDGSEPGPGWHSSLPLIFHGRSLLLTGNTYSKIGLEF